MDIINSIIDFVKDNWTTIFSGIGTTILIGILGYIGKRMKKGKKISQEEKKVINQSVNTGDNSKVIQSAENIIIDNSDVKINNDSKSTATEQTIIVQAGRDAILNVKQSPPDIKLVRVTVEDDETQRGLKQKLNVIMKNNGDKSVFLLSGHLEVIGCEDIVNPNHFGMHYKLSFADWNYDVDINSDNPSFKGQHIIEPDEVINFNVIVGRNEGGLNLSVYKCLLKFKFDEHKDLECGPFFLLISGPTVWDGGFQACGPTAEQWGRAQVDNIKRLDSIGYDYRHQIHPDSRKYLEEIDPHIFEKQKTKHNTRS